MFKCLIGLRFFDTMTNDLVTSHQTYLFISFKGIKVRHSCYCLHLSNICKELNISCFLFNFAWPKSSLLEAWVHIGFGTRPFQQEGKVNYDLLARMSHMFSPFWTFWETYHLPLRLHFKMPTLSQLFQCSLKWDVQCPSKFASFHV